MIYKNLVLAGVIVLIILAGGWYWLNHHPAPAPISSLATSTRPIAQTASSTPPAKFDQRDPWQVLARYLAAAKTHDLKTLTNLSYQVSPVCQDPKQTTECFKRMDSVYGFGQLIKPADYVIKQEDGKQAIYQTDVIADNSPAARGYKQGIIVFTKTSVGEYRVLYFNPLRGWYTKAVSNNSLTPEEKLRATMLDTDEDGKPDQVENCINQPNDCVKTDPNKRDSLGDGWWDGVRMYFYKP